MQIDLADLPQITPMSNKLARRSLSSLYFRTKDKGSEDLQNGTVIILTSKGEDIGVLMSVNLYNALLSKSDA